MSLTKRCFKSGVHTFGVAAALTCTLVVSGCNTSSVLGTTGEVIHQGYVVDEQTLALAPVGSSREQVLLSLGTPSTTATFDGEVFYYISQTRQRAVAFMKPKIIKQSILAVYFDKEGTVSQLANYTLENGKVFDMISRTTPTGGKEMTFLGQVLSGNGMGKSAASTFFGGNN